MENETTSFRKVKQNPKPAVIRQKINRMVSSSSNNSDVSDKGEVIEATSVVQRRKQLRRKTMVHTTNKKRRTELDNLAETSSESDLGQDEPAKFVPDVKIASTGKTEREGPKDMGATARSEIDTEAGVDAQSQFERTQRMLKEAEAAEGTSSGKVYRGMAMYGAKIKEDTVKGNASSGLNRLGPIRATQYMRANVRWDYAPDICKDYKETGFCTFGDSCKFMHDRGDYKHGWEIERDWQADRLKEAKDDEYVINSDNDEEKDDLPHHCFICRNSFKSPVVTKCKHYFCEACAIAHYRKSKKCAVCNQSTDGVFSTAKDIIAKLGAQKKAKEEEEDKITNSDEEDEQPKEAPVLPVEEEHMVDEEIEETDD